MEPEQPDRTATPYDPEQPDGTSTPYEPERPDMAVRKLEREDGLGDLYRAILGAFLATLAMTLVLYAATATGRTHQDIAAMLGKLVAAGFSPPEFGATWWVGMIWHFVNGTLVFALIYLYFAYPVLRGPAWVRGTVWGIVLYLLYEAVFLPVVGYGFFGSSAPNRVMAIAVPLVGHIVYGAILGAVAGAYALVEASPIIHHHTGGMRPLPH